MSTRTIRRVTLASAILATLVASPTRAAAQCTYPSILSPGIWVYLKETMDGGDNLTMSIVNLTDYLLVNGGTVTGENNKHTYEPPFGGVPIQVKDINEDKVKEVGIPPYGSVSWVSYHGGANTILNPGDPQHYHGDMTLELVGYKTSSGQQFPGPTWPNKFHVVFTAQDAFEGNSGKGTWIALRPDVFASWDPRNKFRSGVWTTPHYPADLANPAPDDVDMRNIMTISNPWLVVTLYSPMPTDAYATRNVVVVVRQTNWFGPSSDVRSDSNPVADMDDYVAQKLDWKFEPHESVPRYNTGYYDSPYGSIWGCNCYQEACH